MHEWITPPLFPDGAFPQRGLSSVALCATPARPPRPVSLSSVVLLASLYPAPVLLWIGNPYYTLPPKAYMTFCYSCPVLCTFNEIAFSGISLYTLLSPSSLRTCPERCSSSTSVFEYVMDNWLNQYPDGQLVEPLC